MAASSKAKVLVIDDDPEILGMVRDALGDQEFDIIGASGGDEGLRTARREAVDLIVVDILMPGKDGLETIMDLRRSQTSAKIIAMSGGGAFHLTEALNWAQRIGAQRTLRKPFTPAELVGAVRGCLGPTA
jgi:DNA-binding response OmpR family regulator